MPDIVGSDEQDRGYIISLHAWRMEIFPPAANGYYAPGFLSDMAFQKTLMLFCNSSRFSLSMIRSISSIISGIPSVSNTSMPRTGRSVYFTSSVPTMLGVIIGHFMSSDSNLILTGRLKKEIEPPDFKYAAKHYMSR
jgi:hypothetical protein